MFSASKTAGPSGYNIANSLRFRSSASAYLSRTPASAGNRQTWTWSGWFKRGTLSVTQVLFEATDATGTSVRATNRFGSGDVFDGTDSSSGLAYTTTQVFRDPSSWYHVVIAMDTTQATASNRFKLYVNGSQVTSFSAITYPTLNSSTLFNSTSYFNYIGATRPAFSQYFDGYMAEVNFIDGQALDPSYFGQLSTITGVWAPKAYTGTYGTNGFRLNFSNGTSTTTLGYDSSGNGNNWTTNNISLTSGSTYDWMLDSPTPFAGSSYGVGNYCVFNPVYAGSGTYLSNGNLTLTSNDANYRSGYGTIGVRSGSWYAEFSVGLRNADMGISVANLNNGVGYYYLYTGSKWDTSSTSTAYGASYTTGDVIGIAFDATNLTLTFYKNGVSQGVAFTGMTAGTYQFVVYSQGAGANLSLNAGQRPFAYTPPSGYKSLCTYNLPTPTIQNGANYMAATLYTGNGATQTIVNANNSVSFQPDFVWCKSRSNAYSHKLFDSVRGVYKQLNSNGTAAESTDVNLLTSFGSNGFSLGNDAGINGSGATFVGWQWKAGGTAVTNTAGSITSSVSANAAAGFSVVTFTKGGTSTAKTVGHGLGVAPSMIIEKVRNAVDNWPVYHISIGATNYLELNTTIASSSGNPWGNTTPTSSVFSVQDNGTGNWVAYCFAAIPGYSAFGSYTGNGSADGPFVYCGFRPRFVLFKRSDSTGTWFMFDTSRGAYNIMGPELYANLSDAESTASRLDFLSNGFKMRAANAGDNASGGTYIYAAFCEVPMNFALAR